VCQSGSGGIQTRYGKPLEKRDEGDNTAVDDLYGMDDIVLDFAHGFFLRM